VGCGWGVRLTACPATCDVDCKRKKAVDGRHKAGHDGGNGSGDVHAALGCFVALLLAMTEFVQDSRLSITRLTLPSERSSEPGARIDTFADTPIVLLMRWATSRASALMLAA